MKIEFNRSKCAKVFKRDLLANINERPEVMEQISGTIEKVEIVSNNFRAQKKARCSKCIFVLLSLFLVIGGGLCALSHMGRHGRHGRHHRPNRPNQ